MNRSGRPLFAAFALLALAGAASAAVCGTDVPADGGADPDRIFAASFEPAVVGGDPSGGAGGELVPGDYARTFTVPGGLTKNYYYRVPPGYVGTRARPVVVVLHGAAADREAAARGTRASWSQTADAADAFVLAPVSSGSQGGYVFDDEANIRAALADFESRFQVDRKRRYLWGFSAGGHVAHALALDPLTAADQFAAYAVNAGALDQYVGVGAPAAAAHRIPISSYAGGTDPLLSRMRQDRDRFLAAGWSEGATLRYQEFLGGHTYKVEQLAASLAFMCGFERP